jgi:hypothetical protein
LAALTLPGSNRGTVGLAAPSSTGGFNPHVSAA